jgi:hypothetical protein
MPRAPDGTYTLPLPPVISGQTVEATWANQTLADISAALTDSLSRTAQGELAAPLKIIDGVEAAPGLSFVNEANTGIHRPGPGDFHISVLGQDYFRITNENGVQVSTDGGTSWSTVLTTVDGDDLTDYIDDREVTAVTWNAALNELTLTKTVGNLIETIDTFNDLDINGQATLLGGLGVGAEVNQLSLVATGGATAKVCDTTLGNRFIVPNETGGAAMTITITKPVGARSIGADYTIEGNVIVENGAAPGAVSLAGVAAGDILGTAAVLANQKSLLSYVIHNRSGVYTELYIWSAAT